MVLPVRGNLCNPCKLGAELGEDGVLLWLNVGVKLRLDLARGCVQQDSRELNCRKGGVKGGKMLPAINAEDG